MYLHCFFYEKRWVNEAALFIHYAQFYLDNE